MRSQSAALAVPDIDCFDVAVAPLLQAWGVTFSPSFTYTEIVSHQLQTDHYLGTFIKQGGVSESFDFSKNHGNRKSMAMRPHPEPKPDGTITYRRHKFINRTPTDHPTRIRNDRLEWERQNLFPTQLKPAEVLYCLVLDQSLSDQSFENFCSDCDYDSDSISAFEVYRKYAENNKKLLRVFTRSQLAELSEILSEY